MSTITHRSILQDIAEHVFANGPRTFHLYNLGANAHSLAVAAMV